MEGKDKDEDTDELSDQMRQMRFGGARPKQRKTPAPQQQQSSGSSDSSSIDESYFEGMRQRITEENRGLTPEEEEKSRLNRLFRKSREAVTDIEQQKRLKKKLVKSDVNKRLTKKGYYPTTDGSYQPRFPSAPPIRPTQLVPQNPNQPDPPLDPDLDRRKAAIKGREEEWMGMEDRNVSPINLLDYNYSRTRQIMSKRKKQVLTGDIMPDFSEPSVQPVVEWLPDMLNVLDEDEGNPRAQEVSDKESESDEESSGSTYESDEEN